MRDSTGITANENWGDLSASTITHSLETHFNLPSTFALEQRSAPVGD
jgi:hypothetical protein